MDKTKLDGHAHGIGLHVYDYFDTTIEVFGHQCNVYATYKNDMRRDANQYICVDAESDELVALFEPLSRTGNPRGPYAYQIRPLISSIPTTSTGYSDEFFVTRAFGAPFSVHQYPEEITRFLRRHKD